MSVPFPTTSLATHNHAPDRSEGYGEHRCRVVVDHGLVLLGRLARDRAGTLDTWGPCFNFLCVNDGDLHLCRTLRPK